MSFEDYVQQRRDDIASVVDEIEAQVLVVNAARPLVKPARLAYEQAQVDHAPIQEALYVAQQALESNPAPVDEFGNDIVGDALTAEEIAVNDTQAARDVSYATVVAARAAFINARSDLDSSWTTLISLREEHEDMRVALAADLADEPQLQASYDEDVRDAALEAVEPGIRDLQRQNMLILRQLRRIGVILNDDPGWGAPHAQAQAKIVALIAALGE